MRLHEYEAKDLFKSNNLEVPRGQVVTTAAKAEAEAEKIGLPVVVKSQVLVGGRGKAGGIKIVDNRENLGKIVNKVLRQEIKGYRPDEVLIEEKLNIKEELYCGITINRSEGKPVIIVSSKGGVNIEKIAEEHPEQIKRLLVDQNQPLYKFDIINFVKKLDFEGNILLKVSSIIEKLYNIFKKYDCTIAEVNPLVLTEEEELLCADAVVQIDDSSLYRHPQYQNKKLSKLTPIEKKFDKKGATFVELDGNIGLICSGAGLGMATMDLVNEYTSLSPANFLETGGGITDDLMFDCMKIILERLEVDGILINLYGGINPIHEGARGIVRAIKEYEVEIPVVAKALGNKQEETWETLEEAGVYVVKEFQTKKTIEKMANLLGVD